MTSPHGRRPIYKRGNRATKERSIWRDVPLDQWNDWHWQMRNRITTAEEMARVVPMTPKRTNAPSNRALETLPFRRRHPNYASLIDPDDPEDCPIRLQAVPGEGELTVGEFDIKGSAQRGR